MKSPEVTPKALTAWLAVAMLGPLALTAARESWLAVAVTGVLCALLIITIHDFSDSRIWTNRIYCAVLLLWHIYAAALVAYQCRICWPGKGSGVVVPLVLLVLAALSSAQGADRASRVAATLCPICVIIFALVLACGVGNVQWSRLEITAAAPGGWLLFILLLPIAATAIPRQPGSAIGRCMAGLTLFAVVISVAVSGTLSLPVSLTREDSFYEFAKSLKLFSAVQRFESIAAVAVTLSVYSVLSLLLSGVGHLAQQVKQGAGPWAVWAGAGIGAVVAGCGLLPPGPVAGVLAVAMWGILPLIAQLFSCEKKVKKDENCA